MKARPMKFVHGKGYFPCEIAQVTHVQLHIPGPFPNRFIAVILHGTRKGAPCWTWNADTEKPTLTPSIRTKNSQDVCHCFVNNGRVQFLSDCTHMYANNTMDLLKVEE